MNTGMAKSAILKGKGGFTLIELLLVRAVTSLLYVGALSAFSSLSHGALDKSATDIAGFMELARSHACANNVNVNIGFRSADAGISVVAVADLDRTDLRPISRILRFPNVPIDRVAAQARPAADFQRGVSSRNEIEGFQVRGEQ